MPAAQTSGKLNQNEVTAKGRPGAHYRREATSPPQRSPSNLCLRGQRCKANLKPKGGSFWEDGQFENRGALQTPLPPCEPGEGPYNRASSVWAPGRAVFSPSAVSPMTQNEPEIRAGERWRLECARGRGRPDQG